MPDEIRLACSLEYGITEFGSEFSAILSRLLEHSWDASGDWQGDMQGDATFFAPVLLYALWDDTGVESLRFMADRSVEHEIALVNRFRVFPVPTMDLVIGFPGLAEAYRATGNEACLKMFASGVRTGACVTSFSPRLLVPFVHDRVSVYGTVGTSCFLAYELTGDDSFKKQGLDLMVQADRSCWREEVGIYAYENHADWSQATMMIALVKAYQATGDPSFLKRCQRIVASMDERFRDRERGGYFGHTDETVKALSGNNTLAWACLDLYEATGDRIYLEKVRSILAWILSRDLYDSREGIVYHHWDLKTGRATTVCTGCNFHTLCVIHRLNRLAVKGS